MASSIFTFTRQNFNAPQSHLDAMNEAVKIRVARGEEIAKAADRVEDLYHPRISYTVADLIK